MVNGAPWETTGPVIGIHVVQEEGSKYSIVVTDEMANDILWEYTGWPEFWTMDGPDDTAEKCLHRQLVEFFENEVKPGTTFIGRRDTGTPKADGVAALINRK